MANVTNVVETKFEVGDHATSAFHSIGASASGLGGQLTGLNSLVSMVKGALVGLAAGAITKGITDIGSKFEQNQIMLGGMMAALGQAGDINEGLKMADQTIQAINNSAAKLPGEAEEYVQVFKGVFPQVQRSIGGTLKDMYGFSNQLAAIGKSFGMDAGTIASEAAMMMAVGAGRAGSHITLWRNLLPYIQKASGLMTLNAEEFNKMSEQARGKLIQGAFAGLQPMLDKSAETFDAMWGALASSAKLITRLGTAPLFAGIKQGLGDFNALLMDENGALTATGQHIADIGKGIAENVVHGTKEAVAAVLELRNAWDAVQSSPGVVAMKDIGASLLELPSAIGSLAAKKFEQPDVLPAGQQSIGAATESTFTSLMQIGQSVVDTLMPVADAVMSFGAVLVDLYRGVIPGLASMLSSVFGPALDFVANVATSISSAFNDLRPIISEVGSHIGALASSIGNVLGPVLHLLGNAASWLYDKFAGLVEFVDGSLLFALEGLVDVLKWVADQLAWLISKIPGANGGPPKNGGLHDTDEAGMSVDQWVKLQNTAGGLERSLKGLAPAKAVPPKARGGGHTTQDFRYSRFQIDQKFAEGMDPDRIVTTMLAGIQRQGERKLQSAHEPGRIR